MTALVDKRYLPIQLDRRVVDMTLKAESFKVYCWLASKATEDGVAMPSQQDIGDACFSADYGSASARLKHAQAALKDLVDRGLVVKQRQTNGGLQTRNLYVLPDLWERELPAAPVVHQPAGMQSEWVQPLCYILYGHTKTHLLMPVHWRNIRSLTNKLVGCATLKQVQDWYKTVWVKNWPGNKGDKPAPSQVISGVAAYVEAVPAAQANPSVVVMLEESDE